MIKFIKVTGKSLSPFFLPGDYVISLKVFRIINKLKLGDTIVFNQSEFGILIKKVIAIDPDSKSIIVAGTDPDSIGSARIGPVHSKDIIGKVVYHIKNREIYRN